MLKNFINNFLEHNAQSGRKTIPARDQIAECDTWDLSALYPDEEAYQRDFNVLKSQYPSISQFKTTLIDSPSQVLACMELNQELNMLAEHLYHYASLRLSEDGSNSQHLERHGKLVNLLTNIAEHVAFIEPELQALDDNAFEQLLGEPKLQPWNNYLKRIRRFKPHALSPNEERLLAMASGVTGGIDDAFSQLNDVDMRFGEIEDIPGRFSPLSQGSIITFLENPDRSVRRKAFEQFYREFSDHKYTIAALLSTSVKGDVFYARARNYPSALEKALFQDNIPPSVYDNLIKAVRSNLEPLRKYLRLRRRAIGIEQNYPFDLYIPLVTEQKMRYSFDQAADLILQTCSPLGTEYTEILGKGLRSDRWCDRYETVGKRSGAFSSSSYGKPAFILMNYEDESFSSVYTLAHEAGHSMHSWYSQKEQLYQDYHYPIFLAEVASTFNEELLTHHFLKDCSDPKLRAYIINRQIDEIRGAVYRQTLFAEFEKITHAMEESGEALTLESFCRVYRELLSAYFGEELELVELIELECLRIPHFYRAFYVYKYATGLAAAVALSQRVLHGGEAEAEAYLGFLKSGRSKYPLETLQLAGVDMSTPEPIEKTLQLFSQRVDELESLLS